MLLQIFKKLCLAVHQSLAETMPSIATLLPTGKGTSASHLTATEDKFVSGEATIIEIAGVYKRYHCPMARTVLVGQKKSKKN